MPRLEAMVRAHAQEILCLKASPLQGTFVTGGNDRRVRVWSLQSYELLATLEGHTEAVTCLAIDANFLLSGSEDSSVRVWDLHSHMALGRIAAHDAPVEAILVLAEQGYLVSCSTDRTVRVWDYGAGEELKVWRHPEEFRCLAYKRSTEHIVPQPAEDVAPGQRRSTAARLSLDESRRLLGCSAHARGAPEPAGSPRGAAILRRRVSNARGFARSPRRWRAPTSTRSSASRCRRSSPSKRRGGSGNSWRRPCG